MTRSVAQSATALNDTKELLVAKAVPHSLMSISIRGKGSCGSPVAAVLAPLQWRVARGKVKSKGKVW